MSAHGPLAAMRVLVALMLVPARAAAQDATELAKKTQNPVGDIVSVPFQFNFNTDEGLQDRTHFNLNFQPVMPIRVTSRINLIARTIVPFHSFPRDGSADEQNGGFGDIQQQVFLTPARPGNIIWGVGPMFSLPTATASPAQTGTWAGGFSAVWDAPDGQEWTVPFGLGITKTVVFKRQPMSLGFQYFKNVVRLDDGPGTTARFNLTFIFPMTP